MAKRLGLSAFLDPAIGAHGCALSSDSFVIASASEAIQGNKQRLDCFVAMLLPMMAVA